MMANGGLWVRIASSCSVRISFGTKPEDADAPRLRPELGLRLLRGAFRSRPCGAAPAPGTAARRRPRPPRANAAVSLTRVIGPCRIGYCVPCDFASGEPSDKVLEALGGVELASSPARRWSARSRPR